MLFLLLSMFVLVGSLHAQSIISGDITGIVKDPSGAVLPNATVNITNIDTNIQNTATTNGGGQYRFSLVPPGTYKVTVQSSGFQNSELTGVIVTAGQPTTADIQMTVASSSTTVNVTEAASVVQSENADVATTFSSEQVLNIPNPGGDLTYVAQTAPGVVMNTQSGYGNFSAFGMPGTSNLFTVNGQNFNDPFLGLNNSGASNLLLGANDIAEANVINNAYSTQYGQYAGSQVSYTTKSGTNAFHGNAMYMWNGRAVNANDFFDNQYQGRPFVNFNQWATDVNGPIWKNHTFFDVDYESLRVVLPTQQVNVRIPSQQFQTATLANLQANGNAAEIPFYQQIFALQNGAPGATSAAPVAGGCGSGRTAFTLLGPGVPCAVGYGVTPPNTEREYLWSARVDHNFSDKDRGYIRVSRDNGFQPTYTDYLNPVFNAQSIQPQMSAQVSETHTFSGTTVNQLNGSVQFGAAVFNLVNSSAALQALPTVVSPVGSFFSRIGGESYAFPQGRRNLQYQIIDDLSKIAGKHTFRLGFSWLHTDTTDLGFSGYVNGRVYPASLTDFYNGEGANSYLRQNFPSATEQPIAFNTFGGYVSDDWKVSERFTLSLNLRLENYANPTCGHNCFSRFVTPFTGALADPNTPYNQSIISGQHDAFANTQTIVWEPRVGIAWRPSNSDKTVIRAGAGIFADELPGTLAESAALNPPGFSAFTIYGNQLPNGFGTFAPGAPNSFFTTAAQANRALLSQFASGGTLTSIEAAVPGFTPPNFTSFPSLFKQPTYYKWNFELQQEFGWKTVLSLNYVGNHGIHIPVNDNGLNAYCPTDSCGSFTGFPNAQADPRFGTVSQYIQAGVSSYNGLVVSLQRRLSSALTFNLNYTWSHALDVVSNGGFQPFNDQTNVSILSPQNPYDVRAMYGNADEDVRHYVSFGWVASDFLRHSGFRRGPSRILGGWTLSGNVFYRTGLPFTVVDTNAGSLLNNYGATIFATPTVPGSPSCTNAEAATINVVTQTVAAPCLSLSQFASSAQALGIQGRNNYRGPNFFDMDLALMKDIAITEHVHFSFGAQAYNLLNHPNFDQPINDIANPQFGQIQSAVGPPTSILGSFVGGSNSPRFVEFKGIVRF